MSDEYPKLVFEDGLTERETYEMEMRGYLSHVAVQDKDGTVYPVYFMDPIRLQQDLDAYVELGEPCLAEPGLIVVPRVTLEAMDRAVRFLWDQGYFKHMKGTKASEPQ